MRLNTSTDWMHSMGGCTAYGFSRVHGSCVAGFFTMKGGCPVLEFDLLFDWIEDVLAARAAS